MSLQKFMFVNAVPFGLARLQGSASKTVINLTGGIGTMDSNDFRVLPHLKKTGKKIAHYSSQRMIKKRNKLLRGTSSSQTSQEKLKLQRGLLEQQLLDAKMDKMRLFLENEDLKLRCSSLEEENNFLRMQWQTFQNCQQDKRDQMCEDTLGHAEGVGSSTGVFTPVDSPGRVTVQFSTETVNCIPSSEDLPCIQTLDKICDTSTRIDDTDVFVVPLSQDVNQPSRTDVNAVARTICHEEEIPYEDNNNYMEEAETVQEVSETASELFRGNSISFPEPWTFDNLYEDPDDGVNFYI